MVDPLCVLRKCQVESIDRLFFSCDFSKFIWNWCWANSFSHINSCPNFDLKEVVDGMFQVSQKMGFQTDLMKLTLSTCFWHIWKVRNEAIF